MKETFLTTLLVMLLAVSAIYILDETIVYIYLVNTQQLVVH